MFCSFHKTLARLTAKHCKYTQPTVSGGHLYARSSRRLLWEGLGVTEGARESAAAVEVDPSQLWAEKLLVDESEVGVE